jgi:hypothetical protein
LDDLDLRLGGRRGEDQKTCEEGDARHGRQLTHGRPLARVRRLV